MNQMSGNEGFTLGQGGYVKQDLNNFMSSCSSIATNCTSEGITSEDEQSVLDDTRTGGIDEALVNLHLVADSCRKDNDLFIPDEMQVFLEQQWATTIHEDMAEEENGFNGFPTPSDCNGSSNLTHSDQIGTGFRQNYEQLQTVKAEITGGQFDMGRGLMVNGHSNLSVSYQQGSFNDFSWMGMEGSSGATPSEPFLNEFEPNQSGNHTVEVIPNRQRVYDNRSYEIFPPPQFVDSLAGNVCTSNPPDDMSIMIEEDEAGQTMRALARQQQAQLTWVQNEEQQQLLWQQRQEQERLACKQKQQKDLILQQQQQLVWQKSQQKQLMTWVQQEQQILAWQAKHDKKLQQQQQHQQYMQQRMQQQQKLSQMQGCIQQQQQQQQQCNSSGEESLNQFLDLGYGGYQSVGGVVRSDLLTFADQNNNYSNEQPQEMVSVLIQYSGFSGFVSFILFLFNCRSLILYI